MTKRMFSGLTRWIKRKREERLNALLFERQVLINFNDEGIRVIYPDGTLHEMLWKNVLTIAIETNDSGPSGADLWWVMEGTNERCAFPQGATGETEVVEEAFFRFFPGFKYETMAAAMVCIDNQRFICWERHAI